MPRKGTSRNEKSGKGNQAIGRPLPEHASSDMAPQSTVTTTSRPSSQTVTPTIFAAPSTSTSSGASDELADLPPQENEDPGDENPGDENPGNKKSTNISRSDIHKFCAFSKSISPRRVRMIKEKCFGAAQEMGMKNALPAPLIRQVASLIDKEGILKLPGVDVNLYELAPCVIGCPNEGDFVSPALGIPEGFEHLEKLFRDNAGNKLNLNTLIAGMKKEKEAAGLNEEETKKADELFMYQYMIALLGLVHAPNTTISPNLSYLGPLCTGQDYRYCDYFVNYLVTGIWAWRNKTMTQITGDIGIPIVIAADLAILEGDHDYSPEPGFPRYAKSQQERIDLLAAADWETLRFRPIVESVYKNYKSYHPRRGINAGSSHASSPQPRGLNRDEQPDNCQAAALLIRLHLADAKFINCFSDFMNSRVDWLDEDAKNKASALMIKLKTQGKSTSPITRETISDVLRFISEHKCSFGEFVPNLKTFVSAIDEIDHERMPQPSCQCYFTYPHGARDPWIVGLRCRDLKCLAPNREFTDIIIGLCTLHFQGDHILPDLRNSGIHGKYYIMDPLYYNGKVGCDPEKIDIGLLKKDVRQLGLANKEYIFFPVNGDTHHWSVAVTYKGVDQNATILHLDSFDMHDSAQIFTDLERYMRTVLQFKGAINTEKLEVPKQNPDCRLDCGVFMLCSIYKFIKENGHWQQIDESWYEPEAASAWRSIITALIHENKMRGYEYTSCSNAKKWEESLLDQ